MIDAIGKDRLSLTAHGPIYDIKAQLNMIRELQVRAVREKIPNVILEHLVTSSLTLSQFRDKPRHSKGEPECQA